MVGGSIKSWSAPWLVLAVGACSNIIGVSEYRIDPALDEGGAGSRSNGSQNSGGDSAPSEAGETAAGGASEGGISSSDAGGESAGGTEAGGDGGGATTGGSNDAGGEPANTSGCHDAGDCDDTIDCTVDTCDAAGECLHTPTTSLCDAVDCETCTTGIGCVAGPKTTSQLLADPNFDETTSGWKQNTNTHILSSADALSSPMLTQLGPAAVDASEYSYADVYQNITVPIGVVALSLTLDYRFTPGTQDPTNEYVVAALYKKGATDPFTQFYEFEGDAAAQTTWKAATYKAPDDEVATMAGKQFSFDLVAHSFDGVYLFDNLQLNATVCQ